MSHSLLGELTAATAAMAAAATKVDMAAAAKVEMAAAPAAKVEMVAVAAAAKVDMAAAAKVAVAAGRRARRARRRSGSELGKKRRSQHPAVNRMPRCIQFEALHPWTGAQDEHTTSQYCRAVAQMYQRC